MSECGLLSRHLLHIPPIMLSGEISRHIANKNILGQYPISLITARSLYTRNNEVVTNRILKWGTPKCVR